MATLPLAECAEALGVDRSTLARWLASGAPVVRRGRRGRGKLETLVDPEQVAEWRRRERSMLAKLGAAIPQIVADAVVAAFNESDGPGKRASARLAALIWYRVTVDVTDRMRVDASDIPEVDRVPANVARLRDI